MEHTDPIIATNTRYPKPLHDALQKLAREHKRSFNAEVMWALQCYVNQEEVASEVPAQADGSRTGKPGN